MLERIHIENYKCLRDVTVDLGDFTILIGPNDSGKTSFLEVIQTLGTIGQQSFQSVFSGDRVLSNLVWRKAKDLEIVWEASGEAAGSPFNYRIVLSPNGQPMAESLQIRGKQVFEAETVVNQNASLSSERLAVITLEEEQLRLPIQAEMTGLAYLANQGRPPFTDIAEALASSIAYHFDLAKLPAPSIPQPDVKLDKSGGNLAAVLDVLQNSAQRSAFDHVQKSLHAAIPSLSGIVLPPARQPQGAKALEFILSGNGHAAVTIPGALASGGALLLTAFLTLAHTQTPGLILIEEPENGLHPSRLQSVLDILRKISRGEVGSRKRQIILTTHNPLMLNFATPEEVRVFVRHPETGTRILPMTEVPDLDRLLKEFALGELWYLLGEEKMLEGQRP